MKTIWIIVAFISGMLLPIQAGVNIRLGKSITSPIYASMLSFIIGAMTLTAYILITKQEVTWAGVRSAPGYAWLGGALGAFFVTATMFAYSRIGPALTFGLVVAGQMAIAIAFDHFKILVAEQHSVNIWRIIGMSLIILGVIIIQKF
jgi:bacterial/archaeal transporter family-2 protein